MEYHSDARAEHRSIALILKKRFSNNWMLDTSYTYATTKDSDSNERSVSSSSNYPMQQDDLSYSWGYADFDVRHKFVLSGAYQLPYNFMASTIIQYRSGFPYSAGDDRDNNGDGYYNEQAMYQDERRQLGARGTQHLPPTGQQALGPEILVDRELLEPLCRSSSSSTSSTSPTRPTGGTATTRI